MKHSLPPLDSLKVFEAAARHLSFSLAADELCLTKGAVSYQIRKLESQLQCPLFRRVVRQVYLTEAGQQLLKTTQSVFAELEQRFEHLRRDARSEVVSIGVTTYVAVRWLSASIARFNECHPQVSVVFKHSVNAVGFNLQDVDLAVRWDHCDIQQHKNCLAFAPLPMTPALSPKVLSRLGLDTVSSMPKSELLKRPWREIPLLCEDRSEDLWAKWYGDGAQQLPHSRSIISDANVRVQAAIDGHGWMLADRLMHNELKNGLLMCPFEQHLSGVGYALLSASKTPQSDAARLLCQWLAAHLAQDFKTAVDD